MEIICETCGKVIPAPEWKTVRDGEIEHTYFVCAGCGSAYPVSVTDGRLRKRISDYEKMAVRLKEHKCSEQFQKRVQRLKEENVKRSRELAKEHPLAPLLYEK